MATHQPPPGHPPTNGAVVLDSWPADSDYDRGYAYNHERVREHALDGDRDQGGLGNKHDYGYHHHDKSTEKDGRFLQQHDYEQEHDLDHDQHHDGTVRYVGDEGDEDDEMRDDVDGVGEGEEGEEDDGGEFEDEYSELSSSPSIPDGDIDFAFVYALHTFVATVDGQATTQKGDTLVLLDDTNSYWWLVRNLRDESIGYLPAEHIETPAERLARANKYRNVDAAAASPADLQEARERDAAVQTERSGRLDLFRRKSSKPKASDRAGTRSGSRPQVSFAKATIVEYEYESSYDGDNDEAEADGVEDGTQQQQQQHDERHEHEQQQQQQIQHAEPEVRQVAQDGATAMAAKTIAPSAGIVQPMQVHAPAQQVEQQTEPLAKVQSPGRSSIAGSEAGSVAGSLNASVSGSDTSPTMSRKSNNVFGGLFKRRKDKSVKEKDKDRHSAGTAPIAGQRVSDPASLSNVHTAHPYQPATTTTTDSPTAMAAADEDGLRPLTLTRSRSAESRTVADEAAAAAHAQIVAQAAATPSLRHLSDSVGEKDDGQPLLAVGDLPEGVKAMRNSLLMDVDPASVDLVPDPAFRPASPSDAAIASAYAASAALAGIPASPPWSGHFDARQRQVPGASATQEPAPSIGLGLGLGPDHTRGHEHERERVASSERSPDRPEDGFRQTFGTRARRRSSGSSANAALIVQAAAATPMTTSNAAHLEPSAAGGAARDAGVDRTSADDAHAEQKRIVRPFAATKLAQHVVGADEKELRDQHRRDNSRSTGRSQVGGGGGAVDGRERRAAMSIDTEDDLDRSAHGSSNGGSGSGSGNGAAMARGSSQNATFTDLASHAANRSGEAAGRPPLRDHVAVRHVQAGEPVLLPVASASQGGADAGTAAGADAMQQAGGAKHSKIIAGRAVEPRAMGASSAQSRDPIAVKSADPQQQQQHREQAQQQVVEAPVIWQYSHDLLMRYLTDKHAPTILPRAVRAQASLQAAAFERRYAQGRVGARKENAAALAGFREVQERLRGLEQKLEAILLR